MKNQTLALALVFAACSPAYGATITLKDGAKYEGRIIWSNDTELMLDGGGIRPVTLKRADISQCLVIGTELLPAQTNMLPIAPLVDTASMPNAKVSDPAPVTLPVPQPPYDSRLEFGFGMGTNLTVSSGGGSVSLNHTPLAGFRLGYYLTPAYYLSTGFENGIGRRTDGSTEVRMNTARIPLSIRTTGPFYAGMGVVFNHLQSTDTSGLTVTHTKLDTALAGLVGAQYRYEKLWTSAEFSLAPYSPWNLTLGAGIHF